ncbi:tRNA (adenosine(37)-N6)-threonylcarbamoyltransferase complex dimerization subunit type 1 TsaB [Pedobacter immunditicola]|uniref:tRNA (adenosine(37)-N6)-threonylcarbamoyltransferase complex dimerization subunit type 1 TsaB n=1 Tax=Pedobacter immunditicola TaxID=3133440 RepID=UPI0030B13A43
MAKILQIETATQTCSVALAVDGKNIALKEETAHNIHASSLTLFIQEVMQAASLSFQDLDAVAVSKGPGSYTGLRIGVSTAKGLCYASDKPLIAVDTLAMMAHGFRKANPDYTGLVCPMIDARRMEVYTCLFDHQLKPIVPVTAKIIDGDSFSADLQDHKIAFIGDGALKCNEVLQGPNADFSDQLFNSAANMTVLAEAAYKAGKFEDVAYFEPYYLKDFMFTTPKKKAQK